MTPDDRDEAIRLLVEARHGRRATAPDKAELLDITDITVALISIHGALLQLISDLPPDRKAAILTMSESLSDRINRLVTRLEERAGTKS